MATAINEEKTREEFEKGHAQAEVLLKDEDKLERFLQRLEHKMKVVPLVGERLADIPVLVSMVRNYVKKEYVDVPIGTIVAILSALIYFVSPIDLIPDMIPVLGLTDDAAVIALCWKMVGSDVRDYMKWRDKTNRTLDL